MKAVSETVRTEPPARPVRRVRWLALADGSGLIVACALSVLVLRDPDAWRFALFLAALGAASWLYTRGIASLATILTRNNYHVLFAPGLAGIGAFLAHAALGIDGTLVSIVVFVVVWTAWIWVVRTVRRRLLTPTRVITFGHLRFHEELRLLPNVSVRVVDAPPESFDTFDVVAIDPLVDHDEEWSRWLLHADMAGAKIVAAPLVIETLAERLPLEALHRRWAPYLLSGQTSYTAWKRAFDLLAVVALAPLLLITCVAVGLVVYLDDGSPVLFFQNRVGKERRPFRMAKFRTMSRDAERHGATFASHRDSRLTRSGAFLRKYRLDELPQFFHVLQGHMSIIGPRPEQLQFSSDYEDRIPLYQLRYNVRPGITGWAQVKQGYAGSDGEAYEKLRYDCFYVRHHSPFLDARIVLKTIRIVLTGFGAR